MPYGINNTDLYLFVFYLGLCLQVKNLFVPLWLVQRMNLLGTTKLELRD